MPVAVQTAHAVLGSLSEHGVVEGFAYSDLAWVVDHGEPEAVRRVAVTDPGIGIGEGGDWALTVNRSQFESVARRQRP